MKDRHTLPARGDVTNRVEQHAAAVHTRLTQFVAIHDDIFAAPLVRSIRRLIPIPGLFRPIPYAQYALTLGELRRATDSTVASCTEDLEQSTRASAERAALSALAIYCAAFSTTLEALHLICAGLAREVDEQRGPSLNEYNSQVAQYDQLRRQSMALGADLNSALLARFRQTRVKGNL